MKAILLAAGRGSRMQQFTDARPKCLVELQGKPLLEWQLLALRLAGVTDIAIVTGYRRELLAERGLVEFHNPRWAQTNMLSSLACASNWLGSEPCLVSYTDIFYEPGAIRDLMACSAPLAITYDPDWRQLWERRFEQPLLDAETFRLDAAGMLSEIGQPPQSIDAIEGQYMGLLRFTPESWDELMRIRATLPADQRDRMHMTGMLQRIIDADRLNIAAIAYRGRWGEIDTQSDLRASDEAGRAFVAVIEDERARQRRNQTGCHPLER